MALKTKVTELPDSRVRLDAEVPSEELESRVQRTAAELGRDLRIPGFRKGKVPGPMVIQRIGREAVLEQAVRDSLPEWYEEAIVRSGLSTVGDPKLDMEDLPVAGRAAELLDRGRRHAEGEARQVQASSRSASARPRCPRRRSRPELDRLRDSVRAARQRRPARRSRATIS